MEHSVRIITGPMIAIISKQVLEACSNLSSIVGAYGFGSFFRDEHYNDIDITFVTDSHDIMLLQTYDELKRILEKLGGQLSVTFDFLLFTEDEFLEQPLREMNNLTLLFKRNSKTKK